MLLTEYTIDELRSLNEEQLAEVNGIGPERATAIRATLAEQSEYLDELIACVKVKQTKGGAIQTAPTVCFTGKMPEKRSYYEDLARERGYEPASSVTKELSLLVAADPSVSGGKLKKAAGLGVKVVSLDEWLNEDIVPVEDDDKTVVEEAITPAIQENDEPEQMTFGF
jgi:NAD-dependent DNA ligase